VAHLGQGFIDIIDKRDATIKQLRAMLDLMSGKLKPFLQLDKGVPKAKYGWDKPDVMSEQKLAGLAKLIIVTEDRDGADRYIGVAGSMDLERDLQGSYDICLRVSDRRVLRAFARRILAETLYEDG
jgi:hypothetical protein